jgi:hypothetical protein
MFIFNSDFESDKNFHKEIRDRSIIYDPTTNENFDKIDAEISKLKKIGIEIKYSAKFDSVVLEKQ